MTGLDWLTARPIAHRGLHDAGAGRTPPIVENTASAFAAAIACNYAIECDVQRSADGEAMVHHDDALGRLTEGDDELAALPAEALKAVPFRDTADRMQTLGELCAQIAGRVPLIVEIKADPGGDVSLAQRVATVLGTYAGPAAAMSFDPRQVLALRALAPELPRGIVAERRYDHPEWDFLDAGEKRRLAHLTHGFSTQPHFVAYRVDDLPSPAPFIARRLFGLPLLAWTVRNDAQRARARRFGAQIIFEGFRP